MPEIPIRRLRTKRIILIVGGLLSFVLLLVVACRIAVQQMFLSIETSRATGLAAVP
jgi:hypothetical protein